jgi:AcrR family transcriptional regulator
MDPIKLVATAFERRHEPGEPEDATAMRVVDAATRQLELFGIQRTTMEDVARRAGVSRVTVYRHFPTKDRLVEALVFREVQRFLTDLGALMDSLGNDEERMVEGFVFTVRTLRRHTLLQRLLEAEPELFLPQLTTGAGPLISFARSLIVDYLRERFDGVSEDELAIAAEVGVRLTLSLVLTPETIVDLDDIEGLRRLAHRYIAPIVQAGVASGVTRRRPRRVTSAR